VPDRAAPAAAHNRTPAQKDRVDDEPMAVLQRPRAPRPIQHRQKAGNQLPHRLGQGTGVVSTDAIPAALSVSQTRDLGGDDPHLSSRHTGDFATREGRTSSHEPVTQHSLGLLAVRLAHNS
jgi:hypothetical protein